MQPSCVQWIEAGSTLLGALSPLSLVTGVLPRSKQNARLGKISVRSGCLVRRWLALISGAGIVAFAGTHLLTSASHPAAAQTGPGSQMFWLGFALGAALVLFILKRWPSALILDEEGVYKEGAPESRIDWQELSHLRRYKVWYSRGIVVHTIYGKQLALSGAVYPTSQAAALLLGIRQVPFHSSTNGLTPISILKAPVPRP